MPVAWRVENGLVWLESEQGSFDDWKAAVDAFLAHPDYRTGMGIIYDRRKLRRAPGVDELKIALAFVQSRRSKIGMARWALVVGSPAEFGMGRMAQILIGETEVRIRAFFDPQEAEMWVRGST